MHIPYHPPFILTPRQVTLEAELFDGSLDNAGLHLKKIFEDGELLV